MKNMTRTEVIASLSLIKSWINILVLLINIPLSFFLISMLGLVGGVSAYLILLLLFLIAVLSVQMVKLEKILQQLMGSVDE